jgi:hypothetical protein
MIFRSLEHFGELGKYASSYTSQLGEDGILEEIFRRLNIEKGWFVELGANDGVYLSNTRKLYEKGWQGVYIEGCPDYFNKLTHNCGAAHNFLGFVSCEQGCMLDDYLDKTEIPDDFDLLSLDIDSNDYWVLKSLKRKPKVVIVEYNSNFHSYEQKSIAYDPNFRFAVTNYYGASCGAFNQLMEQRGYTMVCCTNTLNLIFVRNDLMNDFTKVDTGYIPYVCTFTPDGKSMVSVNCEGDADDKPEAVQ